MLVRISHRIVHEFAVPARGVTQILRLTPRNHEGQRIAYWRIDADLDCALRAAEDAFGNITHACTAAGPMNQFAISTAGVAGGATERFPPELYLRPTDLTHADDAMREFARAVMARADTRLARMHELMDALHERMTRVDRGVYAGEPASKAFAAGAGGRRFRGKADSSAVAKGTAISSRKREADLLCKRRQINGPVVRAARSELARGAQARTYVSLQCLGAPHSDLPKEDCRPQLAPDP